MHESASVSQALFNLVLWIAVVCIFFPAFRPPYHLSQKRRWLGYVLLLLFCLFPFWGGDYFHYKEDYYEFLSGGYAQLEPAYQWIMVNISPGSYTVFRLIVWGSALFFLLNTYSNFSYSRNTILFVFAACYLPLFSYARVSLSIVLILFGLAIVLNSDRKYRLFNIILGLIIIGCSEFFHRTALIGVIAALSSFFLINAKKGTILIAAASIPIATFVISYVLSYAVSLNLGMDMFISSQHINLYLEGEERSLLGSGWGEGVGIILTRGALYFSAFLYLKLIFNGKYYTFSKLERAFASFSFIIIFIGVLFLFDLGFSTYVLHYRTLNFAMPANAVFLAAVWRHNYYRKFTGFVIWTSILGAFYSLIYATYCAL